MINTDRIRKRIRTIVMSDILKDIKTLTAEEIDQLCDDRNFEKRMIPRIIAIRELTNCSLKEAKNKHGELFNPSEIILHKKQHRRKRNSV